MTKIEIIFKKKISNSKFQKGFKWKNKIPNSNELIIWNLGFFNIGIYPAKLEFRISVLKFNKCYPGNSPPPSPPPSFLGCAFLSLSLFGLLKRYVNDRLN